MIVYKLTDERGRTRDDTQWGPGVTHAATGPRGQDLCSDGWIHAYEHPLLAVLHDPVHGNFGATARLWKCRTRCKPKRDGQMKLGVRSLTTISEIPLPIVTKEQRIRYAILCAWEALRDTRARWATRWRRWARGWLSGADRSRAAADAAWAAADARAAAARVAAVAAAAEAAADARVAWAVAEAWEVAAARVAAAAGWVVRAKPDINLIALALKEDL